MYNNSPIIVFFLFAIKLINNIIPITQNIKYNTYTYVCQKQKKNKNYQSGAVRSDCASK